MHFLPLALPIHRVLARHSRFLWGFCLGCFLVPSLGTASGPTNISLFDPHRDVRQALESGRTDAQTFGQHLQNPATPPGLRGEVLEQMGSSQEALQLYLEQMEKSASGHSAAGLRAARVATQVGAHDAAAQAWQQVLHDPLWSREVLVLAEALDFSYENKARSSTAKSLFDIQDPSALARLPTPDESLRREAYARVLVRLLETGPAAAESQWIHRRLYIDLAETEAARKLLPKSVAVLQDTTASTLLSRARVLSDRHNNEAVNDTLKNSSAHSGWKKSQRCEAQYLLGKAARKMRHYKSAREYLNHVVTKCPEPWRKKARYLLARVASFSGGQKAANTMDSFLNAYPQDRFSDDVLMWKAKNLEQEKKYQPAAALYQRILDEHSDGDMYDKAQFELAFLFARDGKEEQARKILRAVANNKKQHVFARDQARYWNARLLLYPQWNSWQQNVDEEKREEGLQLLSELATERPASFYGNLAQQLVTRMEKSTGKEFSSSSPYPAEATTVRSETARLEFSPALGKQTQFQQALAFLHAGYDREAALLLDGVDRKSLLENDRLAMTEMYARARARDRSHRLLRESGYALPEGKPEADAVLLWSLAYPQAHAEAILPAAQEFRLPASLLFGLSREESAFEAEVVSWAGAIGLCQLMPFTAREEAERLRVDLPSLEALRNPQLNARLGAAHLARRMSLGHPLLAIAAYNAGPGNVNKWRKAYPDLPLDSFIESIPVEQTRNYVKKVTGSWVVYTWMTGAREAATVEFALDLPALR